MVKNTPHAQAIGNVTNWTDPQGSLALAAEAPETGPTVLVVEANPLKREIYGSWLERAGFETMLCPGPRGPSYECIGGRGGPCALAQGADAIVLDAELEGEAIAEGTSASELLSYYTGCGTPVVLLGADPGLGAVFEGSAVRSLRWPPDRDSLPEAVEVALGLASRGLPAQ